MGRDICSDAENLFERLREKGCRVRLLGDQIEVIGTLEPQEITEIRERKSALVRLFSWGTHRTVTIGGQRWLLCSYRYGRRTLHPLDDRPSYVIYGDDLLAEFLRILIGPELD